MLQYCNLQVAPDQVAFVASNAFSLAQASYEPDTYPLGIFCDGELVGFLMWDFDSDIGVWEVCRLMVAADHLGKGIGTAAVQKLLDLVTNKLGHIMFYTSVAPENAVAMSCYEKLGFRKDGRIVYDEVMLEKQL